MIPGFGTLERMLFWELVRVFTLALIGLTGLFVIAGLIQTASQLGLSARQIFQIIPLFIPSILPYTIPATTLFASCVVYGRFSNDNEAVAVKAAGIDLLTMLRPAFLLGVLTMVGTAAISLTLIPRTQVMMYEEIMRDPEEVLHNRLKKDRFLKGDDYMLYVRDVQGKRLLDVVIKRKSKTKMKIIEGFGGRAEYDFLARTQQARLSVDMERKIVTIDADRWLVADNNSFVISDGTRPMENELPDVFSAREIKNKPMALEWNELGTRVQELSALRVELTGRQEKQKQLAENVTDPVQKKLQAAEVTHFEALLKDNIRNTRNVEYEFYIRPALAAGCLVFALIGCPVGIYFNRADYLSSFVTCFLPTVFLYYPLLLSGGGLAKDGKIPMLFGVWGANMIMGTLALILIFRLIKR